MPAETASLAFVAIAGSMALVWLIGVRFAFSRLRPQSRQADDRLGIDLPEDAIAGEDLIEGTRELLAKRIAERLMAFSPAATSPLVKVTECTPARVAFERIAGMPGGPQLRFDAAVMTLTQEGSRVRVRYAVSLKRFSTRMRIAAFLVCFGYGGLFVFGVPLLIWHLVLPSEDPAIRGLVFQTFQMVHGVWPPFLLGSLSSSAIRATTGYFEGLLADLKHAT